MACTRHHPGEEEEEALGLVTLVGLVTIAASTYMITYSHQLYTLFEPVLGNGEVRFTYLPADQKGDIGMGPDLKPNFSMDSRTSSAREFLSLVAELVRQPTGECAYAAALPLAALPNVASQLTSLGAIGGEALRQELLDIKHRYGDARRTSVVARVDEPAFQDLRARVRVAGIRNGGADWARWLADTFLTTPSSERRAASHLCH